MHIEITKGNGDIIERGKSLRKKMLPVRVVKHWTWGYREIVGSSVLAGVQNLDVILALAK